MDIIHPYVAGIDVHKETDLGSGPAARPGTGRAQAGVRSFNTSWRALRHMADWQAELGVTDVAMEATGISWWPV